MPSFRVLTGCFVLFCLPAFAQGPDDDPKAGTLVDCGPEKAVIFGGTESPDDHFAVGWTIRPDRKKTPVDWSGFTRDNSLDWLDKYPTDNEKGPNDYALVDGLLDLQAKKFTAFTSEFPYWPHKNHGVLNVAWSDGKSSQRYVLVGNDARFWTVNLWLVRLGADGPKVRDLSRAANAAVKNYLCKRDPKDFDRYGVTYDPTNEASPETGGKPSVFGKTSVTVHFDADIPKDEVNQDDGNITFALPQGTVLRVAKN